MSLDLNCRLQTLLISETVSYIKICHLEKYLYENYISPTPFFFSLSLFLTLSTAIHKKLRKGWFGKGKRYRGNFLERKKPLKI